MKLRTATIVMVVIALIAIAFTTSPADAGSVKVSIRDASSGEGGVLTFFVVLSRRSSKVVTVGYATVEGTADDSSDYVAHAGTVKFKPGRTRRAVSVAVNTDVVDEPEESMNVVLARPRRAKIRRAVATGTIVDDDGPPLVSVSDASVDEDDPGGTLGFVVTLSAPSGHVVTVDHATADDTATDGEDYTGTAGTTEFAPGETSKVVGVPVIDDADVEGDECVLLTLTNATNADLDGSTGAGMIVDEDLVVPVLSVADAEGGEADGPLTFGVSLDAPGTLPISVNYIAVPQTANAADFGATAGALTIEPGETDGAIDVPVFDDLLDEEDTETFALQLYSPTNARLEDGDAIGAIGDDDLEPSLAINNVVVTEPIRGSRLVTFTVKLSAPSGRTVSVDFATANRSARAPGDYTARSGTVVFEPGDVSEPITIAIRSDNNNENREEFNVNLSNPVNATILDGTGTGKIDDAP